MVQIVIIFIVHIDTKYCPNGEYNDLRKLMVQIVIIFIVHIDTNYCPNGEYKKSYFTHFCG